MDELSARGAGRSVKLFLADGTAHGIVIAEMGSLPSRLDLAGPAFLGPAALSKPRSAAAAQCRRHL